MHSMRTIPWLLFRVAQSTRIQNQAQPTLLCRRLATAEAVPVPPPRAAQEQSTSDEGGQDGNEGHREGFWNRHRILSNTVTVLASVPAFLYLYVDLNRVSITKDEIARSKALQYPPYFYGREDEIRNLSSLLDQPPDRISILTGPSDAGKTTLLNRVLDGRPNTIKIDLRQRPVTTVNDFVRFFNEMVGVKWLLFRSWLIDFLPITGGENFVLKENLRYQDFQKTLQCVTEALECLQRERRETGKGKVPVIALDEFNTVMEMENSSPEGKDLIQSLLSWCIHVTKERQLAHVVIASSDVFIVEELEKFRGIHGRYRFVRLGDLTPDEAVKYVSGRLASVPGASSQDARKIVDTVGGRFLHINNVIHELTAGERSLSDCLDSMLSVQKERLLAVLLAGTEDVSGGDEGGDLYTPLQVWQAMKMLADTPGHVVDYHLLKDEIFNSDETPLRQLIDQDILGFRAGKTPDLVGATKHVFYVTPDSPLIMTAFKALLGDAEVTKAIENQFKAQDLREKEKAALEELKSLELESKRVELMKSNVTLDAEVFSTLKDHMYMKDMYLTRLNDLSKKGKIVRQWESSVEERRAKLADDLKAIRQELASLSA